MASMCSKSVSSLNGICSSLESGGVPFSVCVHLQGKFAWIQPGGLPNSLLLGFFFWSVTEGLAKQHKIKNQERRKKTQVVQSPQLLDLPALNLASSEDDLVSVKTPIKAHQENPEENRLILHVTVLALHHMYIACPIPYCRIGVAYPVPYIL